MPTYIGENKIADRYLGDKFLEAVYIGDKKVYDPYTEITGNLPVVFKSRATVALKNYRIYGTAEGAGVETENLWNPNAKDTSNGYMNGYYLRNNNRTEVANTWCVSEYIEVAPNTQYTLKWTPSESPSATLPSICQYDVNKDFISNSGTSYDANNIVTITTTATTKYIRFSGVISRWNAEIIRFNLGSTVIDVPPGYKLPLTVESGEQPQDIPVYIGDSKLGKEEYVDYKEQKIYKFEGEPPYLQPTTPPVPLPPIPTYKGENTLSSTETLGEVTVKGRIGPRQWPLTNLIFHRYDEYYPELEHADTFAVSEPFYLETGAYILQQTVVTVGNPVVVIQTKEFTGGIFPSSDGYWHVSTPGFYRFQVNKDVKEINNPYTAAQLEELGKTSTITKV